MKPVINMFYLSKLRKEKNYIKTEKKLNKLSGYDICNQTYFDSFQLPN